MQTAELTNAHPSLDLATLMCPTSPSGVGTQQMSGQDAANCTAAALESGPSEQYRLIQKIRRKYNQEFVEGRSAEDEEAIRELVTCVAHHSTCTV